LIDITFATAGPDFNNVTIKIETSSAVAAGTPQALYDADTRTLTVTIHDDDATGLDDIADAIEALDEVETATETASAVGDATLDDVVDGRVAADVAATASTDLTGGGVILDSLVFELSGAQGAEVFSFEAGVTVSQIAAAVNLVSDATGVSATDDNGTLQLDSVAYGSRAFVDINVISEGVLGTFKDGLTTTREEGTDIQATVNGITANGRANSLSINTATLDLSLSVTPGSSTDFEFTITGGGALFQLGPDVVTNQQARLGIQSVNTASLGGVNGLLYELGSGGAAALDADTNKAALIIDEAINQVTSLRGRLGAFQRTTVDTNIAALNDTLVNLIEAESVIRDADFAVESANLTRAQILVQSGTSVLAIANSNPQNVLALLR
jgi:flagellin